jgi:hypothetical protein
LKARPPEREKLKSDYSLLPSSSFQVEVDLNSQQSTVNSQQSTVNSQLLKSPNLTPRNCPTRFIKKTGLQHTLKTWLVAQARRKKQEHSWTHPNLQTLVFQLQSLTATKYLRKKPGFRTPYQKELVESPKRDREKLKSDYSLLQSSSF